MNTLLVFGIMTVFALFAFAVDGTFDPGIVALTIFFETVRTFTVASAFGLLEIRKSIFLITLTLILTTCAFTNLSTFTG